MVRAYVKHQNLRAVPFDKGDGLCLMTAAEYESRLREILNGRQFARFSGKTRKPIVLEVEDRLKSRFKSLHVEGKISKEFFEKASAGAGHARLYGLAKVYKANVPLRPILSLLGSCYDNLTSALADWVIKLPDAAIESSTVKVKEALMDLTLEEDETLVSLDFKSLFTNVPVEESIDLAAEQVFARDITPKMSKEAFIVLMKLALKNIVFQCGEEYCQKDGVAMGSKRRHDSQYLDEDV